jgi:hypothetical protein
MKARCVSPSALYGYSSRIEVQRPFMAEAVEEVVCSGRFGVVLSGYRLGKGITAMMGEALGRQDRLFCEFDLEDMVPSDHLLRKIDAVLDLSWLRGEMAPHYSHLGCPSVCPELMVRMLIVGYCYSIRSERRLCQEMAMNLAYR